MANTKITSRVLADNAVLTANITDANVTTAKVADNAVTGDKVADDVALAGNPTTTTQSAGNNTTRIATTAFVSTAVANLADSAPDALNTLNELAAAMGDDANFSTTVTNSIAAKLPLAGGTMTGNIVMGDDTSIGIADDAERIEFDGAGDISFLGANVGIGTTSPTTFSGYVSVHHKNTAGDAIHLIESDGGIIGQTFVNDASGVVTTGARSNHPWRVTTNDTERLRVDTSGNVGIRNNSPVSLNSLGGNSLVIGDGTQTNNLFLYSATTGGTVGYGHIAFADSNANGSSAQYAGLIQYYHGDNTMAFYTGSTKRMLIDSSGNVGIGTANPAAQLHVATSSGDCTVLIEATENSAAREPHLQLRSYNTSGNPIIEFGDHGGFNGSIEYENQDNSLRFAANAAERMRIDSSGNLLVGTTSAGTQAAGGVAIVPSSDSLIRVGHANGTSNGALFMQFSYNAGAIGSISQNGTSQVLYNVSSDARLKEITGSARGLEVINALNPVSFDWKADGQADEGLIAQEVEKIVPNAVSQNEQDYYQMDYSKLVTNLIAGMKEQQTIIEDLKARIKTLEES